MLIFYKRIIEQNYINHSSIVTISIKRLHNIPIKTSKMNRFKQSHKRLINRSKQHTFHLDQQQPQTYEAKKCLNYQSIQNVEDEYNTKAYSKRLRGLQHKHSFKLTTWLQCQQSKAIQHQQIRKQIKQSMSKNMNHIPIYLRASNSRGYKQSSNAKSKLELYDEEKRYCSIQSINPEFEQTGIDNTHLRERKSRAITEKRIKHTLYPQNKFRRFVQHKSLAIKKIKCDLLNQTFVHQHKSQKNLSQNYLSVPLHQTAMLEIHTQSMKVDLSKSENHEKSQTQGAQIQNANRKLQSSQIQLQASHIQKLKNKILPGSMKNKAKKLFYSNYQSKQNSSRKNIEDFNIRIDSYYKSEFDQLKNYLRQQKIELMSQCE